MNSKKCPHCESVSVIKKGYQQGIQKWKCKECLQNFQANKKSLPKEEIFCSFVFHKQTFTELSESYHIRHRTLQKIFDEYVLPEKIHKPREIYLVVDGTYFGETGTPNSFCLVVFRDEENKEDIWWKFCRVETYEVYKEGKDHLESLGYVIKGVTADGLPLIRNVFRGIKFQMCLVHMERIIIRGTTKFPILEAGKVLLAIASTQQTRMNYELELLNTKKCIGNSLMKKLSASLLATVGLYTENYYVLLTLFTIFFLSCLPMNPILVFQKHLIQLKGISVTLTYEYLCIRGFPFKGNRS